MSPLGHDRLHAELLAEADRFADALHTADLTLPVPTCPEWTIADLLAHFGFAHRWPPTIVERRSATLVQRHEVDDVDVPEDRDARAEWVRAGARRLGDAVRDAGPETAVWTWATDKTAGFWLRRILHDTLVH